MSKAQRGSWALVCGLEELVVLGNFDPTLGESIKKPKDTFTNKLFGTVGTSALQLFEAHLKRKSRCLWRMLAMPFSTRRI